MSEDKINKYLEVIEKSIKLIREELNKECVCSKIESHILSWICPIHGQKHKESKPTTPICVEEPKKVKAVQNEDPTREEHVQRLMSIDCWPEAVSSVVLNVTEDTQRKRAKAILDLFLGRSSLVDMRFLDVGCGEGWLVREAANRGAMTAVGYDIIESDKWKEREEIYTTNISEVENYQYDIIFLYDVLDHCHDPVELMDKLKDLLSPKGTIYAHLHPWFAKHSNHLYQVGLNKAYIHLFLTYEEIRSLGFEHPYFTRPEPNPLEAYNWWFHKFKIQKEKIQSNPLHEFFLVKSFTELLAREHNLDKKGLEHYLKNMEIDFVDFTLTHV